MKRRKNMSENVLIKDSKKMHCFGVAEFMYREAPKYGLDPNEMYTLGLLHDIGYIYEGWHEHEEKGAELMRSMGYKYADEIGQHGIDIKPDTKLSKEAMLLIAGDSVVDFFGNIGTYESRRHDIETRYGDDKDFWLDRFDRRINYLKAHGFNY